MSRLRLGVCTVSVLLTGLIQLRAQQNSSERFLHVTVTDPLHRFVTGLAQEHFEVKDSGGMRIALTKFAEPDTPIAIAVVADTPVAGLDAFVQPGDVLIQSQSVDEAVRMLAASGKPRRAVVLAGGQSDAAIPASLSVVRINAGSASKALVEARNQYVIGFVGSNSVVEVALRSPSGLPVLKANAVQR